MPIVKKWGKKIFHEKVYEAEANKWDGSRLIPLIKMPDNLLKLNNSLPRVTYDSDNQWCIGFFDKAAAEKLEQAKLAKIEADKQRKEELDRRKREEDGSKLDEIPGAYNKEMMLDRQGYTFGYKDLVRNTSSYITKQREVLEPEPEPQPSPIK
jgi:hypothetical protein